MSDDLYQILGVKRDATPDEIKRRYRALAKELHPDLNPDRPEVGERFKLVTAAYDILSDDDKRGRYDRGEIDATGQERPQHHHYRDFAEDPAGTHFYTREGFHDAESMQDFFADLFGGREGGSRVRARGADVAYSLPIDFLEAAKGAKQRVVVGEGHTIDLTIPARASVIGRPCASRDRGCPASMAARPVMPMSRSTSGRTLSSRARTTTSIWTCR